jgi:hypothetical protein
MRTIIPGLIVTDIKPRKPMIMPLKRRVLVEKWYAKDGFPDKVTNINHWICKYIFAPNDILYLINPVTVDVETFSVADISQGYLHSGLSLNKEAPFLVRLYGRKDLLSIDLTDAVKYLNKPRSLSVRGLGERYVCCSENAMFNIVGTHLIPKILESNKKTQRINCSRKKWEAKKHRLKILEGISKKIIKILNEND